MPYREATPEVPLGQPQGKAKQEREFIAATSPQEQAPETPSGPAPTPITPNVYTPPPAEKPAPPPDVQGNSLSGEEWGILSQGRTNLAAQHAQGLAQWLPVLQEIANLPQHAALKPLVAQAGRILGAG